MIEALSSDLTSLTLLSSISALFFTRAELNIYKANLSLYFHLCFFDDKRTDY